MWGRHDVRCWALLGPQERPRVGTAELMQANKMLHMCSICFSGGDGGRGTGAPGLSVTGPALAQGMHAGSRY
jgi:hypothetical protein